MFVELITISLGGEFDACLNKMGGKGRLKKEEKQFLRSICKLAYSGLGEYEKGDGKDFKLWLEVRHI